MVGSEIGFDRVSAGSGVLIAELSAWAPAEDGNAADWPGPAIYPFNTPVR